MSRDAYRGLRGSYGSPEREFVVADATAEIDQAEHAHVLTTLGYACCRVVAGGEVVQAWAPAAARRDDLVRERG